MKMHIVALPWRGLVRIAILLILIFAGNFFAGRIADILQIELLPSNENFVHRIIMASAAAYVILMAVPFVPGVEIGLALIAMLGPPIVFLVYLSTIAGLLLSFAMGRFISLNGLSKLLRDLRFDRSSQLIEAIEPMSKEQRLQFLAMKAPVRIVPFLLRHRYLTLAVLFNLPGNFLFGGGGGIAMVAGLSGLYSTFGYVVTVALAVSPVPIAVLMFGSDVISR